MIELLEKAVLQAFEGSVHLENNRIGITFAKSLNFATLFKSSKLKFSIKPKYINITICNNLPSPNILPLKLLDPRSSVVRFGNTPNDCSNWKLLP